ncbi:hypothetical protein [Streptosporangium sp. NPDC051022]|uniref:hypothetical protein n=1 Tax=Streptosporangium sp. NPDC051022 TaxID=3155752 RepID=UPI0034399312
MLAKDLVEAGLGKAEVLIEVRFPRLSRADVVLAGVDHTGRTAPGLLTSSVRGPRLLLLAGRTWKVDWIDWKRRRCFVEPVEGTGGEARWTSSAFGGTSFALARAMRDVALGMDPPVRLTRRAAETLAKTRAEIADTARPDGTVIVRDDGDLYWWTWAGYRGNATLTATLRSLADPTQRVDDLRIRLRNDLTRSIWHDALRALELRYPEVDDKAVNGLKFNATLPRDLAVETLATRLADFSAAASVLAEPTHLLIR